MSSRNFLSDLLTSASFQANITFLSTTLKYIPHLYIIPISLQYFYKNSKKRENDENIRLNSHAYTYFTT